MDDPDLIDFLPWRRSVVYELARQPGFPRALVLPGPHGARRVWVAAEVRAWALEAPRAHAETAARESRHHRAGPGGGQSR